MDQKAVSVLVALTIAILTALLGQDCSGTSTLRWGNTRAPRAIEVKTTS